jgi:glycosyltransferase involved in cell wall biosynthesis
MITTFYPPFNFGGDGIFVKRLANELAKRGHQVEVIHCIDSYNLLADKPTREIYDDHANVTVHGLKSRFGKLAPLAAQQTGQPLLQGRQIRRILEQKFDVIHYHNISLFGPKILAYGEAIKLYTMHEYWLLCPMHLLYKFNREVCVKQTCIACSLSYKRPPQWWRYSGMLAKAAKNVDAFLAFNEFIEALHRQANLELPILQMPSFIPALQENEAAAPEASDAPYFLFVGRLEKIKGLQTLFPVFSKFKKAKLLVAGTGNYEAELKHLAANNPRVDFVGKKSESELQRLYKQALAVIVPSVSYEVFPLVILEAFRQHTPVIVRNLGGMPQIVRESEGGLVYDSDAQLLTALERFVQEPLYRQEAGRRSFEAVQKRYSVEIYLENYFALIEKISAEKQHKNAFPSPTHQ